ncbi:hypothetical protein BAJUN_03080 [Bajunvirus bajun]|uniref:Uncharacterized protein n=1 Tax=Brevundimonas phage vB_BgoS-Bajun TaxID=2948594 RepID=A0A9E7SS49_9CAUD|nr:hypothetical protein BAJUN_03080 [Brevundimonas phage vB_BgoS-Bajun]
MFTPRTVAARLANKFQPRTTAEKLIALKTAADADHEISVQAADKKHTAVRGEIGTAAATELETIRATLRAAARRADALRGLGVTILSVKGDEAAAALAEQARSAAQA